MAAFVFILVSVLFMFGAKWCEDVNKKYGNTVILVTHNDAIKNMADYVIKLKDGQIRKTDINENKIPAMELEW